MRFLGRRGDLGMTARYLRHLRHALSIQPDLANTFDAREDVVNRLAANADQFRAHDPGHEIAWQIENFLWRRSFEAFAKNCGHRAGKRLHLRAERHADVRLAVFVDMQVNTHSIRALLIFPYIHEIELLAFARLLLLRVVRVRDERLASFIFRQRFEEINNLGSISSDTSASAIYHNGEARASALLTRRFVSNCIMKTPIKVAVTGAAGHIGYALVFRIASGQMFGLDQPLALHLIEIPPALDALNGVVMELDDCAFPLLESVIPTADLDEGFRDINWALLVGSVPRKAGMERKELLGVNGKIFVGQGQAIQKNAAADVRVLVVGNPCNTNCLIAMNNAKEIPRDRWFAMTRLDENRARAQLAHKAGVSIGSVTNMTIWGNHSSTQYPDFYNARIDGRPANEVIGDEKWLKEEFIADGAAARRRHHQGAGTFFRWVGRQRGCRHRLFADE